MFKNYASTKTPLPEKKWLDLSKEKRVELITNELKSKSLENFEVFDAPDDGRIV